MSKFTPGPWKAEHRKSADGMYNTEVFSEQHGVIAICYWTPKYCANGVVKTYREANARLIALAPELYDMLSKLQSQFGRYWPEEYNAQVSMLLAKACEEEADHARD